MAKTSLENPAHPVAPEETRECGTCSGCGTTTKTLTAPFTLDVHFSSMDDYSVIRAVLVGVAFVAPTYALLLLLPS